MREDAKTLTFAAIVCVSCSLLLSGTAAGLKSRQQANEAFDVQRNIVKAFGEFKDGMTRPEIEALYSKCVKQDENCELPLYLWTNESEEKPAKYAFPIEGKGLWGDVYGYISLEADLQTIAGISFYKHQETPGLGAEIEKVWFQEQFKGDTLYADGKAVDFRIVKSGGGSDPHAVDGISGATLTGKGVQAFLREDAKAYETYFNTVRGK